MGFQPAATGHFGGLLPDKCGITTGGHGAVVLFTKILTINFYLKRKRTILLLFTKILT